MIRLQYQEEEAEGSWRFQRPQRCLSGGDKGSEPAGQQVWTMPDYYLQALIDRAFEIIPGEIYNQYLQDVSERPGPRYLFYEFSLMEEKPWGYLRDRVYPLFARYLKAKFFDPVKAERVVVAIFHADHCYLLRGADFLEAFRELEGLDATAFRSRVHQWLSS